MTGESKREPGTPQRQTMANAGGLPVRVSGTPNLDDETVLQYNEFEDLRMRPVEPMLGRLDRRVCRTCAFYSSSFSFQL
jgi:hypothetical protein